MSNILLSEINGVKVYNLSSGKTLEEMLRSVNYNIKKLKKSNEYSSNIELIQEFEYPVSSSCIKVSEDGSCILTGGVYPPRLKIFDLNEMTLKVERGTDAEIRKIANISSDFTKNALLLEDRNIEIHAQYGKHFSIRIPKYGRDIIYNKYTCDLMTCGTGNEIFRLNLCEGRFLNQYSTEIDGINVIRNNSFLNILAAGGDNGKIEIWDNKSQENIIKIFNSSGNNNIINSSSSSNKYDFSEISALEFNNDYLLTIGNSKGLVNTYDLRYSNPLYSIKHSYRFPICSIKFHEGSDNIISVDKKSIKFSNIKTGKNFSNIETPNDINDFETYGGSGLFFTANESKKMDILYIPTIGPAPKWCSFIEKITEEIEELNNRDNEEIENNNNEYLDNFSGQKFLIMKDLEDLSCVNLIGSKHLKPYMHGYFMDNKLYIKLKSINQPLSYENYLEEKKKNKLNKLLENRIFVSKNSKYNQNIKVNKELLDNSSKLEDNKYLKDERFTSKLFTNEDFKIEDKSNNKFIKTTNSKDVISFDISKKEDLKEDKIFNKQKVTINKNDIKSDNNNEDDEEEEEDEFEKKLNSKSKEMFSKFKNNNKNKINNIRNNKKSISKTDKSISSKANNSNNRRVLNFKLGKNKRPKFKR